jgi:hypothetical protein
MKANLAAISPSAFLTPALTSYVSAYLMSRAYAETMRQRVDAIERAILTECPIYADTDRRCSTGTPEQIFSGKDLWLCSDEALCADFYAEANKRERAAGLKPDSMPDDHCPALVAEHLQLQMEWKLIDESGRPFGVNSGNIMCCSNGLENRQKWIDLVVGFVVNSPGFKNPLTGAAV